MSDADEMILAGSRPQHSNPIDALHSRTLFVFMVDSLILTYLLYAKILGILALLPGLFFLAVWSGYRIRAAWAYWFVPLTIGFLTLIFCALMIIYVYIFIIGLGSIYDIVISLILGYAIYSSVRFVRIHFHPVYKMGYSGYSIYDEGIKLEPNEMLAACPTCLAVLAVNPLMLSQEDKCPHCDSPLVLGQEEE